jgi:cytidine deaminase
MQYSKNVNYSLLENKDLSDTQSSLISRAKEALKHAYAPYSHFQVGAAVLLDNGEVITGSNQENIAFPSGLCAERVALFTAHHQYPDAKIKAIAVAATDNGKAVLNPIVPCSACIQVMSESISRGGESFEVILLGEKHILHIPDALDLTPFRFEG